MCRFCIASLLLGVTMIIGCASEEEPPKINIELTTTTPVVKMDQTPQLSVSLVNCGKRSVTLVQPGDGSSVGWRTPIISWSGINTDDLLTYRCGNINALNKDEVFTIASGEKIQLNSGWVQPQFPLQPGTFLLQPGTYEVSFNYSNVPKLEWSGIPLGKHDRFAMGRIRNSTPFEGISNTVTIVVVDQPKNEASE